MSKWLVPYRAAASRPDLAFVSGDKAIELEECKKGDEESWED